MAARPHCLPRGGSAGKTRRDDATRAWRRYLRTGGRRNEFDGGVVPDEIAIAALALDVRCAPWQLLAHPEWLDALTIAREGLIGAKRAALEELMQRDKEHAGVIAAIMLALL